MIEKRIDLAFKNQANLALWKIYADDSISGKDVFLTHGTFSNKQICMGISEFLVKRGYICWILEWRNHGSSSKINEPYNFEKIGKEDIKRAFDFLFNEQKLKNIDCITHSGGGISLTINLIEYPENIKRIKRIVFFCCQAFGAGYTTTNRIKLWVGKVFGKLFSFLPGKLIGRPHNEDYSFMKQWLDWNLAKEFTGETGRDYKLGMPQIQIPILSFSGSGDTFVAPFAGCKEYLQSFKNPSNRLINCGKETGFLEDYDHSRLIYSRNAEKEIYPQVLKWITH